MSYSGLGLGGWVGLPTMIPFMSLRSLFSMEMSRTYWGRERASVGGWAGGWVGWGGVGRGERDGLVGGLGKGRKGGLIELLNFLSG